MAATHSRILDDLNSKYTCLFEPVPPGAADPAGGRTDRSYLTSLRVYGNLDDVDDKPLPTNFSGVGLSCYVRFTFTQGVFEIIGW
ncbi:PB1 domain, RWP-RK domain, Lambda repressor-like, DNA-binding domain protein [Artemisia annua]|uniref:PB1 domain, RWP-RK domain, Lambda repressor-like, DNA-binding domain protein n=1 Tax=Artemisia annua TaxID=35608 RepID=A0A2U1MWS5_ARTAN|nr:PB1 domain, RWP-RK domain, Lambda repressor-like, DNA-binding domain protein [Artemisia annua]